MKRQLTGKGAHSSSLPEPDPYARTYSISAMQRQERFVARIMRSAESATHLSEEGELSDSQREDDLRGCYAMAPLQSNSEKACCNVSGCTRETWNGHSGEQCCRTCKASSGKSHGPDCQESLNAATAAASKRVPLAPLPSNSLNQGWVSWRDASGNLVMAEKQRPGSSAQDESNYASDEEDEGHEDNLVTITGTCMRGGLCYTHLCSLCILA